MNNGQNGNRKLHAIQGGIQIKSDTNRCSIKLLDATLVAPGEKNLLNFDNRLPQQGNRF